MSDYLFHLLWTAIWQSMLLATIVLLAVRLLGERLQPRFRYMLWCLVLLRLAVPVLPETSWGLLKSELELEYFPDPETAAVIVADLSPEFVPDYTIAVPPPEPFVPNEPAVQSVRQEARQDEPIVVPETPPVVSMPKIPWKASILAFWLLGVIMFSVRHVFDELRLYRQSRYWKPIDEPAFLELFRCCCREAGVRRQVGFLSVPQDIGAASMGFLRPAVLVSQTVLETMPTDQLRMVLLHELVHVRRFDPAALRLASILSVIYWPNPAIWFVLSRLQRDRELACDAAVLHILDTNKEQASAAECPIQKRYGEAILAFAQRFSAGQRLPGLVGASQDYGNGRKHVIARRIDMILKYKRNKISHAVLGVFLVAVLAAFGLTRAAERAEDQDVKNIKEPGVSAPGVVEPEKPVALPGATAGKLDPKMVRFKGKATLPDGLPAAGFKLLISGRSKKGSGGGTSNTYVKSDGSFDGRTFANADYMITIFDPKGRFAAPSQYFTFKEEEEYPEEIVFKLEEGTRVIGKVVDEKTNKPVPNIELSVSFYSNKSGEVNTFFKITADENGEYAFAAMPTETVYVNVGSLPKYHSSIDFGPKEKREHTRKLLRKVLFDDQGIVNIDFRIPTPFVGKVLRSDGSPAAGASVQMVNYRPRHPEATRVGMFVDTDESGIFRLEERPRHVFCTIWSQNREIFTGWFGDDFLKAEEKVFQLQPACRIEGRLIDSVTKKPLTDQLLFLERSNPKKPEQLDYMPLGITKTDGDGFFNCSTFIGSGVRYELFVVPGRQQGYGGVPTDQRVTLKTVIPEKPGETVSVGDLEVDMSKTAVPKVAEKPDAWREELFKKLADEVRDGKKKLMLKIFVKAPAQETIDYMLKHQNEEPLASFALYIAPYEKLSESGRKQWDSGKWSEEPLTIAVDPITASKPSGVMTFSQLRGESDSTWNVSDGDWKKTPGMVNPEILKRFLRSMLSGVTVPVEKLLQFKPIRDGVDYDKPSPEDARRCTAKRLKDDGYIVTDPQGKTLRKFLDTTGDGRIDQWSYFKDGVEVWRDRDTDGDGLIDISDKP